MSKYIGVHIIQGVLKGVGSYKKIKTVVLIAKSIFVNFIILMLFLLFSTVI